MKISECDRIEENVYQVKRYVLFIDTTDSGCIINPATVFPFQDTTLYCCIDDSLHRDDAGKKLSMDASCARAASTSGAQTTHHEQLWMVWTAPQYYHKLLSQRQESRCQNGTNGQTDLITNVRWVRLIRAYEYTKSTFSWLISITYYSLKMSVVLDETNLTTRDAFSSQYHRSSWK